jgi:hypothetical protein
MCGCYVFTDFYTIDFRNCTDHLYFPVHIGYITEFPDAIDNRQLLMEPEAWA